MNELFTLAIPRKRLDSLISEFQCAWKSTENKHIIGWAGYTCAVLAKSGARRSKRLLVTAGRFVKGTTKESRELGKAIGGKRVREHLTNRGNALASYSKIKILGATHFTKALLRALRENPVQVGPEILVGLLGFYFGSGGIDGDGGIPDLDFTAGIGAHRSILTHSIIAGIAVETVTYSVVSLVDVIYGNLPPTHDIFWDNMRNGSDRILKSFANGASAGISYHLFIDSTLDAGKAYSDLPFSMPMEGHQAIMGVNAAVEGIDRIEEMKGNRRILQCDSCGVKLRFPRT